jgi:hypothetical protein
MSTSSSYTRRHKTDYLFQVRVDPNKFTSWECLQKYASRKKVMDCAINVYHFLEIISDRYEAEQLASLKNLTNGTDHTERVELIYKYMTNKKTRQQTYETLLVANENNLYLEWVAYFKQELKPNHATMVNVYPPTGTGHAILAYMNENNQLSFVDPQQLRIFVSDSQEAREWLSKYDKMYIIMKKPKKGRLISLTSLDENLVKKRRATDINNQRGTRKKRNRKMNKVYKTKRRGSQQHSSTSKRRQKRKNRSSDFAQMDISSSKKRTSSAMDISSSKKRNSSAMNISL